MLTQVVQDLSITKPKTIKRDTQPKIPTFADAVRQQQEKDKPSRRSKRSSEKERKKKKISVVEIDSIMESCIKLIEKASPTALKNIETQIHSECTDEVKQEMRLWKDDNRLNLVHYAIIYKRPEIVHYLLAESSVFPPESQPAISPYAHLAAYLGSTASLKIILNQRPDDFFKTRLPEHDIVLPSHIIKRLDLNKPISKNRAHFDEVLKSINFFKQHSEVLRPVSANVRSDDLNDLITYLQKMYIENTDNKASKSFLPPINQTRRVSSYSHNRIIKPVAYNKLFVDSVSEESIHVSKEKTPLTLAAERCHADTVTSILECLFSRKMTKRKSVSYGPLLGATKAISPEAIATLLEVNDITQSCSDYQDSVLEAIRQLLPDCLIALLSNPSKKCRAIFGGMNLFHMVYTQCLDADDDRYQMLPLMTQALIYCRKDVNNYTLPHTFPLYSLITSSFNVSSTKRLYHTFECLQILLAAGANPFFNEVSKSKVLERHSTVSRPAYESIFHCIFENTLKSLERHENPEVPLVIMKNSLLFVLDMNKQCHKIVRESILFQYLEKACYLGLDKQIVNKMLSSGADPNVTFEGRYSLNIYFEAFFRQVLEFERNKSHDFYKKELGVLIIVCQHMSRDCLREAVKILLNQYISRIPVEAVPVTRYFLYLVDCLVKQKKVYR